AAPTMTEAMSTVLLLLEPTFCTGTPSSIVRRSKPPCGARMFAYGFIPAGGAAAGAAARGGAAPGPAATRPDPCGGKGCPGAAAGRPGPGGIPPGMGAPAGPPSGRFRPRRALRSLMSLVGGTPGFLFWSTELLRRGQHHARLSVDRADKASRNKGESGPY